MSTVKRIGERLGLGRAAYLLLYQPLGKIKQSWREGGPIEQRRTRLGHREMQAAALTLRPLAEPPAPLQPAEVAFLTGPRFWDQTLFCMASLQLHTPFRISPVVYDDGRMDQVTKDRLLRVMPWTRFVMADESEALLDRVLPEASFPALRARRRGFPLMRKLLDVHAGSGGFRMFADSDMLFFRRPDALIEWFGKPDWMYLQDIVTSYGYPQDFLNGLAGSTVPQPVNSGLYAIDGAAIDWDQVEFWCRSQMENFGPHYLQEQTLTAMLFAGRKPLVLSKGDYVVMPDKHEGKNPSAVLHHYVAESKDSYFRHAWRRIVDQAAQASQAVPDFAGSP